MANTDAKQWGSAAAILEQLMAAGGRLLKVEREPLAGAEGRQAVAGGALASRVLRLCFDVEVVEIRAAASGEGLEASLVSAGDVGPLPVNCDEEEPWWALLGCPLVRVSIRDGDKLLLQFRPDDESPRVLVLSSPGEGVRVQPLV